MGYYAQFPTQYARYVRFYLADDLLEVGSNFYSKFYVYQCVGAGCSTCIPCAANYYCPGTQFNETYPCPNTMYSYPGSTSVSQCWCPGNSSLFPLGPNNTLQCACNAGFFSQASFVPGVPYIGWTCVPCPPNMTSLAGSSNYTQCTCKAGFIDISLSSPALSPPVIPLVYSIGGPSKGNPPTLTQYQNLNDGIGNPSAVTNYPGIQQSVGCWGQTSQPYIGYDFEALIPMSSVLFKINPTTDTLLCHLYVQLSATGNFTGEQLTVFSCGSTYPYYCPVMPTNGYSASFNTTYARYARLYTGGDNTGGGINYILQFNIFQAISKYQCSICPSNKYCPAQTFNQSIACPNASYTTGGAANLSQCICPSNAAVHPPANNCSCNVGYYAQPNISAPISNWECNPCPANLSSPTGSASLTQCTCAGGFYPTNPSTSMTICSQCASGYYCPFKNIAPLPCPVTLTSIPGAITCTVSCPPSFYCPGNGQMVPCPSGTYATGGAGTACTPCEQGFYCNTTAQHYVCPPGYYCPLLSTTPIPCPMGSYSLGGAGAQCITCEAGYFCPTSLYHIQCPSIFYCLPAVTAPSPCKPGLYSCPGSVICAIPCPPGGFCPGNGTVVPCPLGTFSNGSAATGCTSCPQGFYCDTGLQLSAAGCV